jgi:hypothetical protein
MTSWVRGNEEDSRHEVSKQKTETGGLLVCIKCGKTWEVTSREFEFYCNSPVSPRPGVVATFDIYGIYGETCEAVGQA